MGKIGPANRILRGIGGVASLAVAFLVTGTVFQVILVVLGGSLVLEGLTGFCPMTYLRNRAALKKQA